jgi:NADH-quinone oxidoreductase subunit N
MPTAASLTINSGDVFFLSPEIVFTAWGLVVLLADLAFGRRMSPEARRRTTGSLAIVGAALGLVAAIVVFFLPQAIRVSTENAPGWLSRQGVALLSDPDPVIFFGTLAGDMQSALFNVLYALLLLLVLGMSLAWSFTEEWGEYFALMFWATVGMMLLTAAEELVTLFVALETMTICLYLTTALEKTKRRSAEGGLKYFVYGSVSSALFLFGLSLLYGMAGTTMIDGIRKVLSGAGANATGLSSNVAGATAILLMLVGFGFKVAAVPFHQWAPDAYEGAPAPVTAWIATGSKLASFVAFMKVFLHAVLPWSNPSTSIVGPGWVGIIAIIAAITMTYGNFAALAQRNLKRLLAYSSIAHAGYILVGVAAISVSTAGPKAAAAVLYYLIVYAFANVGAFALAAWLARDLDSDDIDDLNGLGYQQPLLATCVLLLMLSLIGIPPLAGFFAKLYVFMEALNQAAGEEQVTLMWLVALGLLNSVVSAFYYVRVLKAMFLHEPGLKRLAPAERSIAAPIVIGTAVVVLFGLVPDWPMGMMQAAAVPMLTTPAVVPPIDPAVLKRPRQPVQLPPGAKALGPGERPTYTPEQIRLMQKQGRGGGGGGGGGGRGGGGRGGGGAFQKKAGGTPKGAPQKKQSSENTGQPATKKTAASPATKE